ncbi:uncharacterized protein EAF02_008939 [Botrytis sinoallii]|uniref:uncharacterized protein n=1 Tax=Botrytis sinoallii TaxID=1463999 RepID=UPI001901BDDB|nr:uncharacterized protein EAF02_008939 [Botrytis sinoallii]KAF7872868.1 hypothetical protein EAF02_008939 [Botrytis sinoallii]
MLPDDLASSYSSYKADTSLFTNWLFKSAIACGYKIPIVTSPIQDVLTPVPVLKPQPRLKGKARKLAKESKDKQKVQESVPVLRAPSNKYTITTTEILKQANFVTGKIELPQTVRKVLQRAIQARQRCANWFESSNFENQSSNKGHQHFIGLLKDILSALDQGRNDRSHSNSTYVPNKTTTKSQDTEASWNEISNSFQNLDVEDCLEEDSEVENDEESPEPNTDTPDTCELEEESLEMKMSMMIFYFFEDLHRIQNFLRGIWKRYKDKTLDLLSATLITNAVFELVRRSEQEILSNAPKLFSKKRSYDTIAAVIFYANGLNTGKDPTQKMESKEWLRPTPFDDFIYLSTARILMKYDKLYKIGPVYPIPTLPLRSAYISCPEILGTPYMDKKEKEDVLLSQLIMDLDLLDEYNKFTKNEEYQAPAQYAPPAADALTSGLLKLKDEGNISVTVVFASQIFLDLNQILGDNIREGREDWERLVSKRQRSLDSCLYLPKDTASGHTWSPNDIHTIKKIRRFLQFCSGPDWGKVYDNESTSTTGSFNRLDQESSSASVLQPIASKNTYCTEQGNLPGVQFSKDLVLTNTYTRFPEWGILWDGRLAYDWSEKWLVRIGAVTKAGNTETCNQQLIEGIRQLDIRLIKPPSDPIFFYIHNPIFCGMVALRLLTSYDEAGLAHSDYHLVMTFAAHLYEECVRTNFIQKRWPALETMIKLHRKEVFDGIVPKSADEAYNIFSKHFFLSKVSDREYTRTRRSPNMTMQKLSRNTLSLAIRPFLEHQATFDEATNNLQNLVQDLPAAAMRKDKNRRAKRQLTSLQFLRVLEDFLPDEMPKIQFDYISLTIPCYRLLEKIRLGIDPTGKQNPKRKLSSGIEPAYLYMTLDILSKGRTGGENPLLKIAAGVLDKFLEEEILK